MSWNLQPYREGGYRQNNVVNIYLITVTIGSIKRYILCGKSTFNKGTYLLRKSFNEKNDTQSESVSIGIWTPSFLEREMADRAPAHSPRYEAQEGSGAHLSTYCLWLVLRCSAIAQRWSQRLWPIGPRSLKYLMSGLLLKKFTSSCSGEKKTVKLKKGLLRKERNLCV